MTASRPVIAALFCAFLGSLEQFLFKTGSSSVDFSLSSWFFNWRIMAGFFLYGVSAVGFVFYYKNFFGSQNL